MKTSYQELVDLLYLPLSLEKAYDLYTVPNEKLFFGARVEILSLREKLNRQSTMLAEALKLKNEALRRESSTTCTKDALKREHEEQLGKIRGKLPIRYLHTHLVEAVEDLVARERKAQEDLKEATELLDIRAQELDERLKELEKLRPPEAKFRVGQVVLGPTLGVYYRIVEHKYEQPRGHLYRLATEGWWIEERQLRALTDEER